MDTGLNDCRREAYREVGRTVFGTAKGMQGREITNIDIKKRGVLMCTAATYKTKDFYFGRTLDYEFSYGEEIVIMPRNYPIPFRFEETDRKHYAIIGTAHVADGYPMFYDAVNEKGLGMAGLNFVGNAVYRQEILPTESGTEKAAQAAQYEFITWILSRCANVSQAREKLETLNLTETPYSEMLPAAQLHWILADEEEAITVESVADGLKIYDNPVGVLTNNPPFDMQMFNLNNYRNLSEKNPQNTFDPKIPLAEYSRGMGALGLPGDLSSMSRFVRVAFTKLHSISGASEGESVSQFFHILGSVEQQRGCCEVADGKYEITIYTACYNASRGIYYYTTYDNSRITAIDMHREDLNGESLVRFPMLTKTDILWQNV